MASCKIGDCQNPLDVLIFFGAKCQKRGPPDTRPDVWKASLDAIIHTIATNAPELPVVVKVPEDGSLHVFDVRALNAMINRMERCRSYGKCMTKDQYLTTLKSLRNMGAYVKDTQSKRSPILVAIEEDLGVVYLEGMKFVRGTENGHTARLKAFLKLIYRLMARLVSLLPSVSEKLKSMLRALWKAIMHPIEETNTIAQNYVKRHPIQVVLRPGYARKKIEEKRRAETDLLLMGSPYEYQDPASFTVQEPNVIPPQKTREEILQELNQSPNVVWSGGKSSTKKKPKKTRKKSSRSNRHR
jgi:hypothetical protein